MSLYIERLQIPTFLADGFGLNSAIRKGAVLFCEADDNAFPVERIIVEFEDEPRAIEFYRDIEREVGVIQIDEDRSLNAAPEELRREYLDARSRGDVAAIEAALSELWEDYGIAPDDRTPRETSGVKRIAIMHDDGVNAWGFKGKERELLRWMEDYGFEPGQGMLDVE